MVTWTRPAKADLRSIHDYIARDSEKDGGIGTAKLRWTVVGDELDFENVDEI